MWYMIWPILLVLGSSTLYNISAKSTPLQTNAFASLSVTYFVGAILCLIMFFVTSTQKNILAEYSKLNWTSYILGIAVAGIEFGYINVYRAGWRINTAPLVINIVLICVLLVVGKLLFGENITFRHIVGVIIAAFGLYLIVK